MKGLTDWMERKWKENSHLILILVVIYGDSQAGITHLRIWIPVIFANSKLQKWLLTHFYGLLSESWCLPRKRKFFKPGKNREFHMGMGQSMSLISWATVQKQIGLWLKGMDHGKAKIWFAQGCSSSLDPPWPAVASQMLCISWATATAKATVFGDLSPITRQISMLFADPRRDAQKLNLALSGTKLCHSQLNLTLWEEG